MLSTVIAAFLYLRIMVSAVDPGRPGRRRHGERVDPVQHRPGDHRRRRLHARRRAVPRVVARRRRLHRAVRPLTDLRSPRADFRAVMPLLRSRWHADGADADRSGPRPAADEADRHRAAAARRCRVRRRPGVRGRRGVGRVRRVGGGGGDGRRPRRLVRRHRAVPLSARPPDPAHGDHPAAQGRHRPQPRRLRAEQLPHPRGDRRTARRREDRRTARPLAGAVGERRARRRGRCRRARRRRRGARRPRRAGGARHRRREAAGERPRWRRCSARRSTSRSTVATTSGCSTA